MATPKATGGKKSPADIKRAIEAIEAEIQKAKKERVKAGVSFTALTREQLLKKLQRTESPIIIWQGWSDSTLPGGTIYYTVGVSNPDPVSWDYLALAVFVGNRNPIRNSDVFLTDFDRRFPTLAQPHPFGFSLGPLASTSYNFELKIPAGVDKTSYFGNSVLFQLNFHDIGTYFDRGVFFFAVV